MARILIVGGGCRGRVLAASLRDEGHAVRITTRTEAGRSAIEAVSAECWIGTPLRLATLRHALENVTLACWLLGTASGPREAVEALHGSRLDFFTSQTIDTTVRGLLYEAAGSVGADTLAAGTAIVRAKADYNAIPLRVLLTDPGELDLWVTDTRAAIDELL